MLLEHERIGHGCSGQRMRLEHEANYGLSMDALVSVCSWNTKGNMAWAWMLWSAHSSKHERNYGLGMDALVSALIETRREIWFGHGCSGQRVLLEQEGNYGLGMDALVSALIETRTEIWFGQRCSGQRTHRNTTGIKVWAWMLGSAHSSKHEGNYGLGMDSLVSVMLFEHVQTYWPSQYFVKVVSCRSARYTVRFSESRIPDESKISAFCRKRRSADGTSTSRTSKPSKMHEILRGPVNLGSDEDTDFARLHGDGANNNNNNNTSNNNNNNFYVLCGQPVL